MEFKIKQVDKKVEYTKDQQIAIEGIVEYINKDYDPNEFAVALCGAAGTGKTFSIKAIVNNCKYSKSTIGISAPTHKAVRVLKENLKDLECPINTLASDLGLRLDYDIENFDINNLNFTNKASIKIVNYKVYIIDEASMINASLKKFIENICKKYNIKLIYSGDESQNTPIKENDSLAFKQIYKKYVLNQIVRQDDDNPCSDLLKLLRHDIINKSHKFLDYISKNKFNFDPNNNGYAVLNNKEFNAKIVEYFSNEEFEKDTDYIKLISYTNANVNEYNKFIRQNIITDSNRGIITKNDLILSYKTLVDEFLMTTIENSEEYIVNDIISYTEPKYGLKGYLVKFKPIHNKGNYITPPLFILDHTDRDNFMRFCALWNKVYTTAKNSTTATRSSNWSAYYKFKNQILLITNLIDSFGRIILSRDLDYGFAITSHKSQGSTYSNVLIDVNDIVYNKNLIPYADINQTNRRLYVAISRCKKQCLLKYGL